MSDSPSPLLSRPVKRHDVPGIAEKLHFVNPPPRASVPDLHDTLTVCLPPQHGDIRRSVAGNVTDPGNVDGAGDAAEQLRTGKMDSVDQFLGHAVHNGDIGCPIGEGI